MYLQSSKGLRLHADKKSVLGKIKILTSLLPMSSNFDGFTRKVCQSKDRGRLETDVITVLQLLQCYIMVCRHITGGDLPQTSDPSHIKNADTFT